MRKERRKVKHIKMDLARSYSGMEAKVDARSGTQLFRHGGESGRQSEGNL